MRPRLSRRIEARTPCCSAWATRCTDTARDRQADRISAEVWSAINHLSRITGDSASERPGSTLGYLGIRAGEPQFWVEILGQERAVELVKDWVAGVGPFDSRSRLLFTAPETGLG